MKHRKKAFTAKAEKYTCSILWFSMNILQSATTFLLKRISYIFLTGKLPSMTSCPAMWSTSCLSCLHCTGWLFASFHSFCHTSDIMVCLVSSLDWDWFGTILCHNQIPLLLSLPCLVSRKQAVQSEDHLRIWPGWWADKPISDQSFSHLPPPPTFLTFWSPLFCLLSSSIFTHTSSQHSHASLIELTVYFSWICFVG